MTLTNNQKIFGGVALAIIIGVTIYLVITKRTDDLSSQWQDGTPIFDANGNKIGTSKLGKVVNAAGQVVATLDNAGKALDAAGNIIGKVTGTNPISNPSQVVTADSNIHDVQASPSDHAKVQNRINELMGDPNFLAWLDHVKVGGSSGVKANLNTAMGVVYKKACEQTSTSPGDGAAAYYYPGIETHVNPSAKDGLNR